MSDMEEVRLILIGRSGHGKSATANTILQQQKFKTYVSSTVLASNASVQEVEYENYKLKIIDTPGFYDISGSDQDTYEWIKQETIKTIALSVPGPHAFLYVLKVGRFSEEDIQPLNNLIKLYGPSMQEYIIFVFTHIDDIKEDYPTVNEYISSLPSVLSDIISECGNRVLCIDNRYGSKDEESNFRKQLLETIPAMGGEYYTNGAFKEATQLTEHRVKKLMETYNMSREKAMGDVVSDIQSNGAFYKTLKDNKYSALATFATDMLISLGYIETPVLLFGIIPIPGLSAYKHMLQGKCIIM